jgi:hypothetical protein
VTAPPRPPTAARATLAVDACWAAAQVRGSGAARSLLWHSVVRDPQLLGTRPVLGALRRLYGFGGENNGTSAASTIDAVLARVVALPYDWHEEGTVGADVLNVLAHHASAVPIRHSIETGTGRTTLLLSHLSPDHTVFAIGGNADSFVKVINHPILNRRSVRFVQGPTQRTLPRYRFAYPLDFAMLDGPHGYPFPELEYYYIYPHLAEGALLVIDDIHIPTIFNLFSVLREDSMFELVEIVSTTALLRRTAAPAFPTLGDYWWEQNYNKARFPVSFKP